MGVIVGIFLFSLGGFILFDGLWYLFRSDAYYYQNWILAGGFFGFMFIGLGLWLIVQSGKTETKQNPTKSM